MVKMKNLNNKKTLEMVNKIVISQYLKNLKNIKTNTIRLFKTFPHTGAANISEAINITLFDDLEKLLLKKYNISKN